MAAVPVQPDEHMTPPNPPSGLKRDGALADSAFCSVGLLPSELRLSPAAVMDEVREAAPERGESGWSQLRSARRGSCPAPESSCRGKGLVTEEGLGDGGQEFSRDADYVSWMPRVQQELWLQLHSALRGSVAALEASYTKQCWTE